MPFLSMFCFYNDPNEEMKPNAVGTRAYQAHLTRQRLQGNATATSEEHPGFDPTLCEKAFLNSASLQALL